MYSPGLTGGRFKFDDYYSSLCVTGENPIEINGAETLGELTIKTSNKPFDQIIQLINGLDEEFLSLKKHLK